MIRNIVFSLALRRWLARARRAFLLRSRESQPKRFVYESALLVGDKKDQVINWRGAAARE